MKERGERREQKPTLNESCGKLYTMELLLRVTKLKGFIYEN